MKNYQKAEFPDEEGIQVYIKDAVNKGNPYQKGEHLTAHIQKETEKILMRKDEKLEVKKKIPKNLHAPVKRENRLVKHSISLTERPCVPVRLLQMKR